MTTFYETLTAAINDVVEHGYDSEHRLAEWRDKLLNAAGATFRNDDRIDERLLFGLRSVYRRMVDQYGALKYHPGLSRWQLTRLKPRLQTELNRRVLAAAQLIKLNRQESMAKTIRRFTGWLTSVPAGGTDSQSKSKVKADIKKALSSLPFEERRVAIDQGHKLTASINAVIAADNNALAVRWKSHWRQAGYDFREDHKDRDGKVYLLRNSWALEKGLIKPGPAGYYEDITAVGEEVFCRCWAEYVYNLRDLPPDMLTKKGSEGLAAIREAFKRA